MGLPIPLVGLFPAISLQTEQAGLFPTRYKLHRRKNDKTQKSKIYVTLSTAKGLRTDYTANLYETAEMLRRSLSMTMS